MSDNLPANRAAHLTRYRFVKGQSGNPGGRPKGRSLTSVIRELLDSRRNPAGKKIPKGKRIIDLVGEAVIREVLGGNPTLIKELWDRTEGRVMEKVKHEGGVKITVEYADEPEPDHDQAAEAPPGPASDPAGDEAV